MKKIFISLLSVFVLGVFFAQTTIAQTPSLSDSSTIAYIHMYEIGIVSQQDRNFVISFNLASIVGAQPQIKYGITVTKASSSDQMIYDEKVYDEVLSLAERESINKTISYVLPASLPADTYRFVIELSLIHI